MRGDTAGEAKTDVRARIKAKRTQLRLNQAQLAIRAGIHPASVSNLERGCPVTRSTLEKIARALGLELGEAH